MQAKSSAVSLGPCNGVTLPLLDAERSIVKLIQLIAVGKVAKCH